MKARQQTLTGSAAARFGARLFARYRRPGGNQALVSDRRPAYGDVAGDLVWLRLFVRAARRKAAATTTATTMIERPTPSSASTSTLFGGVPLLADRVREMRTLIQTIHKRTIWAAPVVLGPTSSPTWPRVRWRTITLSASLPVANEPANVTANAARAATPRRQHPTLDPAAREPLRSARTTAPAAHTDTITVALRSTVGTLSPSPPRPPRARTDVSQAPTLYGAPVARPFVVAPPDSAAVSSMDQKPDASEIRATVKPTPAGAPGVLTAIADSPVVATRAWPVPIARPTHPGKNAFQKRVRRASLPMVFTAVISRPFGSPIIASSPRARARPRPAPLLRANSQVPNAFDDDAHFPVALRPTTGFTTAEVSAQQFDGAPPSAPRRKINQTLPFFQPREKAIDVHQLQEIVTRRVEETVQRRVVESVESAIAREMAPDSLLARRLGDRLYSGLYESLVLEKERLGWG